MMCSGNGQVLFCCFYAQTKPCLWLVRSGVQRRACVVVRMEINDFIIVISQVLLVVITSVVLCWQRQVLSINRFDFKRLVVFTGVLLCRQGLGIVLSIVLRVCKILVVVTGVVLGRQRAGRGLQHD